MELKEQLEALTLKLEGQSKEEVKNALEAFETKNKEVIANEVKAVQDDMQVKLDDIQAHADALDVKLQAKAKKDVAKGDAIKSIITDNFDNIKGVRTGNSVQVKAVGDMTLGNLTGDQPRDYNFNVVMHPSQKVNVSQLVGAVNISGGTYTYPRETTSEGAIGTPTEGQAKSQIDYDLSMIDVNTDFIAGYTRYSRKMKNNLVFLESFIPKALRRDYFKAENANFNGVLESDATASTLLAASFDTKAEQLVKEISLLVQGDYDVNGIVISPTAWYDIQVSVKSAEAGYGFPGIVTMDGGMLRINGIPVYQATWLSTTDKYFVGDWSRINKINTEGLSLDFSDVEGTNFVANNITARIESQTALAVEQPEAIVFGDFTAA